METQAKGASFLKVTGILMIIGGSYLHTSHDYRP